MPELPEVEHQRIYLNATCLHQPIRDVKLGEARIVKGASKKSLRQALSGREFAGVDRRGKYLFIELDNGKTLVMHFGMSGDLHYYKDPQEKPEYTRAEFEFENGYHLALRMPRRLGMLQVMDDPQDLISEKELGPDVMASDFDFARFEELLANRRGMIKSALMDQQLMAGIGNVYSDEILFQCKLHPKTKVKDLDEETLRQLYKKMRSVLSTLIDVQAHPDNMPDSYLTPRRYSGAECPRCGSAIKHIKVSGRSAYYCPDCQQKP